MPKKKRAKKTKKKVQKKLQKLKIKVLVAALLAFSFCAYHIYHHPSLVFLPLSSSFYKTPTETWDSYGELFESYSSDKLAPEFLAALAQTESMGNPLALTYWSLSASLNPFHWFRPASTATGILQVTSPTWKEMKNFCLQDMKLIKHAQTGVCRGNLFRFRIFASHSVHLVSAWFHDFLEDKRLGDRDTRKVLSVLHLCGKTKAKKFLRNSLNFKAIGRCGSHKPSLYFSKLERNYKQIRNYRLQQTRVLASK
jgi:hypothetical protein